ncbi:MAG: glycosyltransferase [Clostridia bacterium]|nr:glycosyltransferase [Clostridia bacterium]
MKPLISIIIPVYNAKEYLRECIDSIITQRGFENSELILVDDGSTDVSSAICQMYSERFSNVVYHRQQNGGVSAARNKGVELSRGEYIFFVDADDFLFKGIVAKIIEAISKSAPEMVLFDFVHEYNDFNNLIKYPFKQREILDHSYIANEIAEFMLGDSAMNSVWNKVMKKSIITCCNIKFKEGMKYGEDKLFVLDFLKACGSIYYIPENGYFYRFVPSGAIHKERNDYFYTLLEDYKDTVDFYEHFALPKSYVEERYSKRLAQQIVGYIGLAFHSCSKSAFIKLLKNSADDDVVKSAVQKLLADNCFNDADKKIAEMFIHKKAGGIYRYYKTNSLKSDAYKILHKHDGTTNEKEKITPDYEVKERLEYPFKVTVFTPFYNRRRTIDRVFNSLISQTYKDFEWMIIDDGSSDDISDIIERYRSEADFTIRYYYKKNGGKHTAANYANYLTDSEYIIILDSDDAMPPETIENFLKTWDSIDESKRDEYWSVVGRCLDSETKEPLSPPFPENINESENPREVAATCPGEKFSCIKTAKLKEFPYPEPEGTNFITECVVWNKMDKKYKQYYTNDFVRYYYENEPDSLMTSWYKNHVKEGYVTNYYWMQSVINDGCGDKKYKDAIKMCYYGKSIGKNLNTMVHDIEPFACKLACVLAYPFSSIIKKLRYDKFVG